MTIVAHVHTADDKECDKETEQKTQKKNSRFCPRKTPKKSSNKSSEKEDFDKIESVDAQEDDSQESDPAIPTPPFPEETNHPPFPFDVKHEEIPPVKGDAASWKSSDQIPKEKDPEKKIDSEKSTKNDKLSEEKQPLLGDQNTGIKRRISEAKKEKVPQKIPEPMKKSYITSGI